MSIGESAFPPYFEIYPVRELGFNLLALAARARHVQMVELSARFVCPARTLLSVSTLGDRHQSGCRNDQRYTGQENEY
jgi:hypothetical protein